IGGSGPSPAVPPSRRRYWSAPLGQRSTTAATSSALAASGSTHGLRPSSNTSGARRRHSPMWTHVARSNETSIALPRYVRRTVIDGRSADDRHATIRLTFDFPAKPLGGRTLAHTVVIGGGICGLAAGFTLAEHGEQVTLIEAQDFLGGLATTLRGETGAGFDFGTHAYDARNQ